MCGVGRCSVGCGAVFSGGEDGEVGGGLFLGGTGSGEDLVAFLF